VLDVAKGLKYERILFFLYCLIFFLIPSPFYHFLSVTVILTIVFSLIYYSHRNRNKNDENTNLVILFSLYILVFLYTKEYYSNFIKLQQHLFYLLTPILFSFIPINKKNNFIFSLVFCFSTVVTLLYIDVMAAIDYFFYKKSMIQIDSTSYNRFFSYGLTSPMKDVHPTYLATFLNLTFFLIIKYFKELRINYLIYIVLLIFITINIILLLSLTAIVSFFLLLAYFLVFLRDQRKSMLILLVFLSCIFLIRKDQFKKINRLTEIEIKAEDKGKETNSLNIRLAKWQTSLQVINENLFFGVSPGEMKSELVTQYIKNNYMFCAEKKFGPHNQYLTYFLSFGILGFLILIFILFRPLLHRNKDYVFFFLLMSVVFFTEDFLERQQGVFFFSIFYQLYSRPKAYTN